MALSVEEDVPSGPVDVGLLRADGIVLAPEANAKLVRPGVSSGVGPFLLPGSGFDFGDAISIMVVPRGEEERDGGAYPRSCPPQGFSGGPDHGARRLHK